MTRNHADAHFESNCRYVLISNAVVIVRNKLAKEYNIESGPYYKYSGTCHEACKMIEEKINALNERHHFGYRIEYKYMHGEQKHIPTLKSDFWPMEHTWLCITFTSHSESSSWYVDPTSSQFQTIYDDIPDFYISKIKPRWYYPDRSNPLYRFKILLWMDKHIVFHVNHTFPDGRKNKIKTGIIEWIQYDIWGSISDIIYKIKKK